MSYCTRSVPQCIRHFTKQPSRCYLEKFIFQQTHSNVFLRDRNECTLTLLYCFSKTDSFMLNYYQQGLGLLATRTTLCTLESSPENLSRAIRAYSLLKNLSNSRNMITLVILFEEQEKHTAISPVRFVRPYPTNQ